MSGPAGAAIDVSDVAILLADNDDEDALLVRASLERAGVAAASITWTRTLAGAMAALADRPACILFDLGLPDAGGCGGVGEIVDAAPRTAVIALTGRQERDGIDALAAGAQDYLVKDAITAEMLQRSIRYAMERKRAQATQEQLREISVSAAEQARLERGLLPTPLLRTDTVTCSTYYRPGRDDAVLGGDFYDVVETSDGRVRAIIGDVMGHGPDEAALGVHLRVAWRSLLLAGVPDERILPTMALLLRAEADQTARYVTICDITIHLGMLTVRLAGHPAPILCGTNGSRYLDVLPGLPLGIGLEPSWPRTDLVLEPGSSVVLYTDGLLDAYFDLDADSIGIAELVAAVDGCRRSGAAPPAWVPMLLATAPRDSIDDTAAVVLTAVRPGLRA